MGHRTVPAPFLSKTYHLVDDPSTDDVISWNEDGTTFVVWKTAEFAQDLLPFSFKHSNFSSFVRQLNTYGFRKTVPDKWEFANENFKRGQRELLTQIRRRKAVSSSSPARPSGIIKSTAAEGSSSPSNSGEDLGSTSTSSLPSKNTHETASLTQYSKLSGDNEKLKRENELLSSELDQVKKQCEELTSFLTNYLKVVPDKTDRIMWQGSCGSTHDGLDGVIRSMMNEEADDDENMGGKNDEGLKLFGVWVKGSKKKRGRDDDFRFEGGRGKEIKTVDLDILG